MTETLRRVLITGAAGRIGTSFRSLYGDTQEDNALD